MLVIRCECVSCLTTLFRFVAVYNQVYSRIQMLSFGLLHATESAQEFKAGKPILYKVNFIDKYKRAGVKQLCKANVCKDC